MIKILFIMVLALHFMCKPAEAERKIVISGLVAPPYIIMDETGQVSGIMIDLIRQATMDLGIEPVFKISNWSRAFHLVSHDQVDAIIPAIKSPDREKKLIFMDEPLVDLKMVLIQNRDKPILYNGDLRRLSPYSIGTIRNARVAPEFDQAASEGILDIKQRDSFGLLALGVYNKRLDLMASDALMGLWAAAENDVLTSLEVVQPSLNRTPVYLAISKKSPFASMALTLSESLKRAKKEQDFIQKIRNYEEILDYDILEYVKKRS